ncbi:AMP-binding protein [Candidatus Venteria ishoeyi]|uniref:2-succinylbenzoate--CoA ligase n=1 Tax=Candidatus Venteria ishoeyi TaxID=1899563 RepID=A0A1H6FDJ0_9GAMM|nr:AMP-binding protein [Candidatus Venteria ishoeyi]SEH08138.1 2-succinylbenzoate--CoA ligase [Candidatus Venteria ishoeyi]
MAALCSRTALGTGKSLMQMGLSLNGIYYDPAALMALISSEREQTKLPAWKNDIYQFLQAWYGPDEHISLQTSGSTGPAQTITAQKSRMASSARATLDALGISGKGKALLILPASHVAGKMMLVRAIIGGLDLITLQPRLTWQAMNIPLQSYCLAAATPSQLMGLMQTNKKNRGAVDQIKHLLVGGAAPSPALESWLCQCKNPVYLTYGMTETLSHVALRRLAPAPARPYYQALPGIHFEQNQEACLIIHAPALCDGPLHTRDQVKLYTATSFRWLGRLDFVINSGGLKFHPEQIEAALFPVMQKLKRRYMIAGINDKQLGECLTLLLEGRDLEETAQTQLLNDCSKVSQSKYACPRQIKTVSQFSMTDSGKLDRMRTLLAYHKGI